VNPIFSVRLLAKCIVSEQNFRVCSLDLSVSASDSQRFLFSFSQSKLSREAATSSSQQERKTSGIKHLESHFHANASFRINLVPKSPTVRLCQDLTLRPPTQSFLGESYYPPPHKRLLTGVQQSFPPLSQSHCTYLWLES